MIMKRKSSGSGFGTKTKGRVLEVKDIGSGQRLFFIKDLNTPLIGHMCMEPAEGLEHIKEGDVIELVFTKGKFQKPGFWKIGRKLDE